MDLIASLVHKLARRRKILAEIQEEVEHQLGRGETLEIKCEVIEMRIEAAALRGDDAMPHPAVIVIRPVPHMTIADARVEIDADLSEYL